MAYPPELPPATRTDSTLMAADHARDHNQLAAALTAFLEELGGNPSGGYATLTDRLLGLAAGADPSAVAAFTEAVATAAAAATTAGASATSAAASAQLAEAIAVGDVDSVLAALIPNATSATKAALTAAFVARSLLQPAETADVIPFEIVPKTAGAGKFRTLISSYPNSDGSYNHGGFIGWNPNRNHGQAAAGKGAIALGFEDNFYDSLTDGDGNHGPEFYVEQSHPDGSLSLFRPFYARGSNETGHKRWAIHLDIGSDGAGHFDVYAGKYTGAPVLFTVNDQRVQSTKPLLVTSPFLTLAPATGQPVFTMQGTNPTIALRHANADSWLVQSTGVNALTFYNKDTATHAVFTYGATPLAALSQFASRLLVTGSDITLSPASGASSLTLNTAAAQASVIFQRAGATGWIVQGASLTSLVIYNKDSTPAATFTYGAGVTGLADFASALKVQGNVGFYGKTPVAQPARPTDIAGVIAVLAANGLTA